MAAKTQVELKNQNDTTFYGNNNKEITGAKSHDLMDNIIDTIFALMNIKIYKNNSVAVQQSGTNDDTWVNINHNLGVMNVMLAMMGDDYNITNYQITSMGNNSTIVYFPGYNPARTTGLIRVLVIG